MCALCQSVSLAAVVSRVSNGLAMACGLLLFSAKGPMAEYSTSLMAFGATLLMSGVVAAQQAPVPVVI